MIYTRGDRQNASGTLVMADDETVTLESIIKKRDRLLVVRERLFRLEAALAAHAEAIDQELEDCAAAGRFLGESVALPNWKNVQKINLEEEMARVTGLIDWARPEPALDKYNNDHGLLSDILNYIDRYEARRVQRASRLPLREFVLRRLDDAGEQGVKAGEIRDDAEKYYPNHFHPKSIGMTLYRLVRDGSAHRDGRIWRRVRQEPPKNLGNTSVTF
jgi:hypothetical protein